MINFVHVSSFVEAPHFATIVQYLHNTRIKKNVNKIFGFLIRVVATNFLIRKIAFLPLFARSYWALLQIPVVEKTIPRYLNCDTTVIGIFFINDFSCDAGLPPLRNTTTYVLIRFIVR